MDHLHERLRVIDRGLGQDAVAQIEDVAGPSRRLSEDGLDATAQLGQRREEGRGIEVALHRDVVTQARPPGVEVDAPVEPDDVAARGALAFEDAAVSVPKWITGTPGVMPATSVRTWGSTNVR